MNRAFASLYLLIVFSVIGIGWGVDRLWQAYRTEPEINIYSASLFRVLEAELGRSPVSEFPQKIAHFSKVSGLQAELYKISDFADTELGQQIVSGEIVSVQSSATELIVYKRLAGSDYILSFEQTINDTSRGYLYQALLVGFYFSIALVIFLWVWPLSKDLRLLQKQTQVLGKDGVPSPVKIGSRSTIFGLAQSFNRMSERIRELISTHKEMTYAVSHELRTPLARMKFALEMAANIEDRKVQVRKLASIREDVSEMESLINELLTYAGFEQGVTKLNLQPGDLKALVRDVAKNCSSEMVELKHELRNRLGEQEVYCEWYLLERALHNVISNAQRYAGSRVRITLDADDKDYLVVVEDDGPGVPPEDRSRIFNSFVRLRQNTNFDKSGFGLGLSIVSRIMEWHNGSAKVSESEWGGARFELRWPQQFKLDY